jgi:hypothetical protein
LGLMGAIKGTKGANQYGAAKGLARDPAARVVPPSLTLMLLRLFVLIVVVVWIAISVMEQRFVEVQYKAKRAEVPSNVEAIRTAQIDYDKELDAYLALPSEPPPGIPSQPPPGDGTETAFTVEASAAEEAKAAKVKAAEEVKAAKAKAAKAAEEAKAAKAKAAKAAEADRAAKLEDLLAALAADIEADPIGSENIILNNPADINRAVRGSLNRYKGELEQCYNIELNEDESLKGRWQVSFTVEPTGKTSNVSVKGITRNHEGLEACMLKNVKRWSFPRISYASPYVKEYAFGR